MKFRRLVIPVVVAVIFVGGAFAAYQIADKGQHDAARQPVTTTNETLTQQIGVWQYVGNATTQYYAGANTTVTVYNSSGTQLEDGDDYEWNATDGTIKFKSSPETTDGNTANITYKWYENTQEVREISGPLGTITTALGQSGYLAAGFGLVVFLIATAGIVARFLDSSPRSNR